jgi:hypothetical protein
MAGVAVDVGNGDCVAVGSWEPVVAGEAGVPTQLIAIALVASTINA